MTTTFDELEAKVSAGESLGRGEIEQILASPDLIRVGILGETARKQLSGEDITFGRVCEVSSAVLSAGFGAAGEVRLVGVPTSVDEACDRVRAAAAWAPGVPLTGFSAADLLELAGHDHLALAEVASRLRAAGLEAVAECPIDRLSGTEETADVVRALLHGGLAVYRLTVDRAPIDRRLELAERAAAVQTETGAVCAFAPLPRRDPADTPSTGYDDVRTIAMTRLVCRGIPSIQVDWSLYGPKLAQVALAYGANDVDGVAPVDTMNLGPRRSPREEIVRQIRAAAGVPVERNGRFERLA